MDALVEIDRWALARTAELQREILAAYAAYEFHRVYQQLHNFCVVDLGSFYLDVIKDRLYTTPRSGAPRRSAQTAMWHIARGHGALAGANPELHGRGDLAIPARQPTWVGPAVDMA